MFKKKKQSDSLKGDHNLGGKKERETTQIISSYKLGDFLKGGKLESSQ